MSDGPVPPPAPTRPAMGGPTRGTPAPWGSRVIAVLVDGLVLLVPFSVVESLVRSGMHVRYHVHVPTPRLGVGEDVPWALWAVTVLLWLAYVVTTESGRAATVGKRVRGLVVVDADGRPASTRQVWLRNGAKVVFGATFVLGVLSDLWPLWDRDRQALHDKVAGTYVVEVAHDDLGPRIPTT